VLSSVGRQGQLYIGATRTLTEDEDVVDTRARPDKEVEANQRGKDSRNEQGSIDGHQCSPSIYRQPILGLEG